MAALPSDATAIAQTSKQSARLPARESIGHVLDGDNGLGGNAGGSSRARETELYRRLEDAQSSDVGKQLTVLRRMLAGIETELRTFEARTANLSDVATGRAVQNVRAVANDVHEAICGTNRQVSEVKRHVMDIHPQIRDTWKLAYETRNESAIMYSHGYGPGGWLPQLDKNLRGVAEEVSDIKSSVDRMFPWDVTDTVNDVHGMVQDMHPWLEDMHDITEVKDTLKEIYGMLEERPTDTVDVDDFDRTSEEVTAISRRVSRIETRVLSMAEVQGQLSAAISKVHKEVQKAERRRVDAHGVVVNRLDKLLKALGDRDLLP